MWKYTALLLLAGPVLEAQVCSSPVHLSPTTATRNTPVRVTIDPPPKVVNGILTLSRTDVGQKTAPIRLDGNTVSYTIPADLALGYWAVSLDFGGNAYPACELLSVLPASGWEVKLGAFEPPGTSESQTTAGGQRVVNLTLRGAGFSTGLPEDNAILINGVPQMVTWNKCDEQQKDQIFGQVISGERIDLCHVPVKMPATDVLPSTANLAVRVRQGNLPALTSDLQNFRVYSFPYSTKLVGALSAGTALALGVLVMWLIHLLLRKQVSESKRGVFETLFIDAETDTYSLSKFQFYCWTVAALFGYSYLIISRVIVQSLNWPNIPDGLPAIVGLGAATSVGAQFITNVRGPKGSGAETPNFGDLVTSGGVAAPERVQFFVWTILGAGSFCLTVLKHAPDAIQALDPVPAGLLAMMGLSSAGYLGGKLARKPGPIVNEISITPADSDEAMAAASAVPQSPPTLSQPAEQAKGTLDSLAAATGHAKTAVDTLGEAITEASKAKTLSQAQAALAKMAELQRKAEAASSAAAAEFAAPGAPAGAAQIAEMAQRAAGALQDLTSAVTSAIASSVGPTIPGAAAGPAFTRVIELRGQNLSTEALFEIGGVELPFRMLVEKDGARSPEVVIRETDNPTLARVLRLSIDPAQLEAADLKTYKGWFGASAAAAEPKTFTIINPDGQKSDISFTVPPSAAQSSVKTGQTPAADSNGQSGAAGAASATASKEQK